jgi:hypothetical protein
MNQNLNAKQAVFLLGAGVVGIAAGAWWNMSKPMSRVTTTATATAAPPVVVPPPEPEVMKEPTVPERLRNATTLVEAIQLVRPVMPPESGDIPPAAAWLASWMSGAFSWKEFETISKATHGETMKDPSSEQGSRLCHSGTVVQIERDASAPFKVWVGVMSSYSSEVVRFVALGETGKIVNGSQGRFCGIVTGRTHFPNVSGGETRAVLVVGMFDLPGNRKERP